MTDTPKKTSKAPRRFARQPEADAPNMPAAAPDAADVLSAELTPTPHRPSKQAAVIELLRRPEGATLAEMMAATGWLAHSTRAVLTSLRKQGHVLDKTKRDDVTCCRIAEVGQ